MKGARIEYVRSRPFDRLPIIETGMITELKTYNNELFMWVKPDTGRSPRWVSEFNFRSYVRTAAVEAVASTTA